MKNLLCVCAYVYGTAYQGYIPMYIYSIIKNHPQFHVRIYLDLYLRKDIKRLLENLDHERFDIIENFGNPYFERNIEKRAQRWLINDRSLNKFKYIYIGDIDIYMVDEPNFLKSHIWHMKKSHSIYNNTVRLTIKDFLRGGARKDERVYLFRLTGLHFYNNQLYSEKINKEQKRLLWMIENINKISLCKRIFLKKFILSDDERVLWYLVYKSHLKIPHVSYQRYGNCKKCYRPEHGLHMGIGREKKAYEGQAEKDIKNGINSRICEWRDNFKLFLNDYNTDGYLRELINYDIYVQEIVKQTCAFFGYCLSDTEIYKNQEDSDKWTGIMDLKQK